MSKTTEFEQALIHRDGVSKAEARRQRNEARESLYDLLSEGYGYDEIEDMMAGDYGLEMDYIFDIL